MDITAEPTRRGGLTRIGYGLAVRDPTCQRERLGAWVSVLPPHAVLTGLSAAELRGWWLPGPPRPGDPIPTVQLAVGRGWPHPQRQGLTVLRLREPPDVEDVDGLPVATAPETLLACARQVGLLDLVPLVDSALRAGDCSLDDLHRAARPQRRGAPALRRALVEADGRSESAWESVLRVLHHVAEVEVEPQHVVRDADGRFLARADLWVVGTRRLQEYDGAVHRDRDAHRADLARERQLSEHGWQRHGFTAPEVLHGGGVIRSLDALLDRPWAAGRLRAWRTLVAGSRWSGAA